MADYTAKATITADMSGFISAANQAAAAANNLATALTDINKQLSKFNDSGKQMAQALAPLAKASQNFATSTDQTVRSQTELARAFTKALQQLNDYNDAQVRSNRQNKITDTQVKSMARTWLDASDNLDKVNASLATGARENNNIAQSLATANRQYQQAEQALGRLSTEQRQLFDTTVEDLRLRHQVATALRDTTAELQNQGREQARTRAQVQALAKEYDRLQQLQQRLQATTKGTFTPDQAQAMATFRDRVAQIVEQTGIFNTAQQKVFDTTLQTVEATRQATQARQQAAEAQRNATAAEREAASAAAQTAREQTRSRASAEQLAVSFRRAAQHARDAKAAFEQLSAPTSQQARAFQDAQNSARQLGQQLLQLTGAEKSYATAALAASRAQERQTQLLRDGARAAQESTSVFDRHRESLFAMRSAIGDLQGVIAGWNTTLVNLGVTIGRVFSEQEVAIAHLSRVTQGTQVFIDQMTDSLRRMSTEIPIAFTELAEIGRLGAQVGVANDALVDFTRTVALFSATTDVTAERASIMFARIAELANVPQDEISNFGAAVSALGSNSAATEMQILRTSEQISTVGRQAGLAAPTILGLGAALASLGVRPELARGALQRTLFEIEQAATGASDKTEGLASAMGMTSREMVALRETVGREQFFLEFGRSMQEASRDGQDLNAILREIGFRNVQDIQVLSVLGGNWDFVSEQLRRANVEYQANNFLQRESARLFDTVTARVQMAANAWQNVGAMIGELFAPLAAGLANAAKSAADFVASSRAVQGALGAFLIIGTIATSFALFAATLGIVVFALRQLAPAIALAAAQLRLFTAAFAALSALQKAAVFGAIGLAIAGVVAALVLYQRQLDRTGQAVIRANEANFAAAGGLDALSNAIRQDTQNWREYGDTVALSVRSFGEAGEAQRRLAQDSQAAAQRMQGIQEQVDLLGRATSDSAVGMGELGAAADGAGQRVRRLGGDTDSALMPLSSLSDASDGAAQRMRRMGSEAENSSFAIGLATAAWSQAALEAELMSSKLVELEGVFDTVAATGVDFGAALALEMREAGAGSEYLSLAADGLRDVIRDLNPQITQADFAITGFTRGLMNAAEAVGFNRQEQLQLLDVMDAYNVLDDAADTLRAVTLQTELAAAMTQVYSDQIIDLGNGTTTSLAAIQELGLESAALEATINGLDISLGDVTSAFFDIVNPATVLSEVLSDIGGDLSQLGDQALPTFNSAMSEAGRDMVDFGSNLMLVAQESPVAASALLGMGEAGVQMAAALSDAFATGDIENFQLALDNLSMQATVESISDSFARILGAGADARDELMEIWSNLQIELDDGDIDIHEFAARLNAELDAAIGPVEFDLAAQIDQSQLLSDMNDAIQRIADSLAPIEVPIEDIPEIVVPSARTEDFVDSIVSAAESAGSGAHHSIMTSFDQIQREIDRGSISAAEGVMQMIDIIRDLDLDIEIPIDLLDDEILAEMQALGFDIETIAFDTDAEFRPALDGGPAEQGMMTTADIITAMAQSATEKAVVTPSTNGKPAEDEANSTFASIEASASAADPVVTPTTDGAPAQKEANATYKTIESGARASKPTVKPTVDGSTAESRAHSLWSTLRGILGRTISVPVSPFSTGKLSMSSFIGKAQGGWVAGPGGPTADRIPTLLSSGEFVVKASRARVWGPFLEAINEGGRPWTDLSRFTAGRTRTEFMSRADTATLQARRAANLRPLQAQVASAAPQRTGPRTIIHVNNTYPQAEPTSVTINRSLAYMAVLDGVSNV